MRRCVRLNFHRQYDFTVNQLVADLNDGLFATVLSISTFFVVFCLNAILIRTVLGLGATNLY